MTTTPNMLLVLPTDHDSADIWDTILDTLFGLVDAHDHTTGKGVPIPSAALKINADVAWSFGGTTYALTTLKAASFTPTTIASVAGYADAFFVSSVNNELYWRNHTGTNIQLTLGGSINVSIAGGIGGDYSNVAALLSYDDVTRRYLLQQEGAPRPWAGLATADIDLYQKAASIVNKVTLKSPAALAASYTLTFPGAMPGAFGVAQCDAANNLSFSSTLAAAVTAPDYKLNAALTMTIPAAAADLNGNTRASNTNYGIINITLSGGTGVTGFSAFPITLKVGDQITGFTVYLRKGSDATNTIRAQLGSSVVGGGSQALSAFGTTDLSTNNPGVTTIAVAGLTHTIVAGETCWVSVGMNAGAATTDNVYSVEVTFKRP